MKVKTTIKNQVRLLLLSAAICCLGAVCLSVLSTSDVLRETRRLFRSNSALSQFYYDVGQMDVAARSWLYSDSQEDEQEYQQCIALARQDLEEICADGDEQLIWRFGRLSNMLDYYENHLTAFAEENTDVYKAYQQLQYQCKLIQGTANTYYGFLSDFLQSNSDRIQAQWEMRFCSQMLLLGLFLIVGIAVNLYTSKRVLVPIRTMIENTRRVQQGDFQLLPVNKAPEELMVMASVFSEMASRIEQNIEVIKKNAQLEQMLLQKESNRLAMQNLLTQAELHSLQAQINPHFLFNTLSMISKSAYLSQDVTTSELIDRLAGFLRYALDKSNTNSTLWEEVASIEDYFFIQKKRFGEKLHLSIDMEESVPNLPMPAIILQPLVENSIKHGMGAESGEMELSIKIRYRNGKIRILVEDDGVGMSPDQLEGIHSCLKLGLESSSGTKGASIGLTNVYRRMKMYFGAEMQFNIDSEENCGTLITISLPCEEEA